MTQERCRRDELIAQIMRGWRVMAESYRVIPIKYSFLLKERKRPKKLSDATLALFPEIPFLRILDEDVAREELDWLETKDLVILNSQIENLRTNYAYNTMRNWVSETSLQLAQKKTKVTPFCSNGASLVKTMPFIINHEGYATLGVRS